jgi:hypothetical protein
MPDEMVLLGLNKNAFLFDGKDTLSKMIRKDDPQCHWQNSYKMKASVYRWINFTLNMALSFEHSHAYFAHATEELLVQLHGSHDKEKAPVEEWKDYEKKNREHETKTIKAIIRSNPIINQCMMILLKYSQQLRRCIFWLRIQV